MMTTKYKPYVYMVYDPIKKMYYIGSKTSKGCSPENTLNYLGSPKSMEYKEVISSRPETLSKRVIEVFNSKEEALSFEIFLHDFFDVAKDARFYNKVKQTSTKFNTCGVSYRKGKSNSPEHSAAIGAALRGRKRSEAANKKQSLSMLGKTWSEERKQAYPKTKSEEHKSAISKGMLKNRR